MGACENPLNEAFEFADTDPQRPAFRLLECPRHYLGRGALALNDPFGWLTLLDKGILPGPGGWLDQPAIYLETMELLRHLLAASRENERAHHEARARRDAD